MFKIGDKAVYPAHGVGVVEGIENRHISGSTKTFYILRLLENETTIMIPQESVQSVGLREVIARRDIPAVFKVLRQRVPVSDTQTWNRRHREYMDKIRTGSVYEIAAVLRDLYLLKLDKELSFGERKVLDTARNLLVKELSISQRIRAEKVEQQIENIFHA